MTTRVAIVVSSSERGPSYRDNVDEEGGQFLTLLLTMWFIP